MPALSDLNMDQIAPQDVSEKLTRRPSVYLGYARWFFGMV